MSAAASVAVEEGNRISRYCKSATHQIQTFLESSAHRINLIFCIFISTSAGIVTEWAESRRVLSHGFWRTLDDLSERVAIDGLSRSNRDDFDAAFNRPIRSFALLLL